MKISRISAQNFQGLKHVDLALGSPAVLIAGPNGAGKSSLIEAIRFAILGESARVSLKKDFPCMVREGAKKGSVAVTVYIGTSENASAEFTRDVATGKGDGQRWDDPYLPFVLDAHQFATMDDGARRSFLFSLMGVEITTAQVKDRLNRRHCDMAKVETVLPLLRNGFPAAHEEAKKRASEARGAWKSVTGETYGDKKAEGWEAPTQDAPATADLEAARRDLAALSAELETATAELGGLQQQARTAAEQAARIEGLRQKAGMKARITEKLKRDEADLAMWRDKLSALPPAPGETKEPPPLLKDMAEVLDLFVDLADGSEGVAGYHLNGNLAEWGEFDFVGWARQLLAVFRAEFAPAEHDPETERLRTEYTKAVELHERAIANDKRDLAESDAAALALQEGQEAVGRAPTESDVAAQRAAVERLKADKGDVERRLRELEAAAEAAREATNVTAKAEAHHLAVQAWNRIAEALAPDGIPGELLAEALTPFNDRLRQTAGTTGWAQVAIGADMGITANGRAYGLLSESERWRVDAAIAEAIAHRSGLRMLFLDRFDVLDIAGRRQALDWIADLTSEYETIIATGTFKELPFAQYGRVSGYWLEAGEIRMPTEKAA